VAVAAQQSNLIPHFLRLTEKCGGCDDGIMSEREGGKRLGAMYDG